MLLNCDLHSHSGYAGGVGQISFGDLEDTMRRKGIDVFGTGDCLHFKWKEQLKRQFHEKEDGLFAIDGNSARYMLQTEVIFTAATKGNKGRKVVHTVLLFPSFEAVDKVVSLLSRFGVKNNIGRPFIKCDDSQDVSSRLSAILDCDDMIEAIPAHVMTPQGVLGSKNPVDSMKMFYGESIDRISAVETGLSADPEILSLIPELDDYTLVSNSDAHSAALNRLGREFTTYDIPSVSYGNIIRAIRNNNVARTAEFNPTEGRYFLTGHRAGKVGHGDGYCVYSPKYVPKDGKCPICCKDLTVGVLERALQLREIQGGSRKFGELGPNCKDFITLVPLVEVVAKSIGVSSINSVKVASLYNYITDAMGNEVDLWFADDMTIRKRLSNIGIDDRITENIISVKNGDFSFSPPGFDGTYGELEIGRKEDIFSFNKVYRPEDGSDAQQRL